MPGIVLNMGNITAANEAECWFSWSSYSSTGDPIISDETKKSNTKALFILNEYQFLTVKNLQA